MEQPVPQFIDYHCHLDLYPDYEKQFAACSLNKIATLAVTTTPRAWPQNKQLAEDSSLVRVGLGIHPQLVAQFPNELATFEKYLPETRYVGEIGLDAGPAYYKSYPQQKVIFERIIRLCAQTGGKILSVHCVRAAKDILNLIEAHLAGTTNKVVLHWFSGSDSEARRAVNLGCYFSVNQPMLAKPTAAKLLANIPNQRLLTETDGPFTKAGSRPALPSDVRQTTELLATVLGLNTEVTQNLLLTNLAKLEKPSKDGRTLEQKP
jgi:TatD DNase family protein